MGTSVIPFRAVGVGGAVARLLVVGAIVLAAGGFGGRLVVAHTAAPQAAFPDLAAALTAATTDPAFSVPGGDRGDREPGPTRRHRELRRPELWRAERPGRKGKIAPRTPRSARPDDPAASRRARRDLPAHRRSADPAGLETHGRRRERHGQI